MTVYFLTVAIPPGDTVLERLVERLPCGTYIHLPAQTPNFDFSL
jgi:hypothetical protein